jgi:hypothetical protein
MGRKSGSPNKPKSSYLIKPTEDLVKSERLEVRVTPGFKKYLQIIGNKRKISQSEVLHLALANLARNSYFINGQDLENISNLLGY